MLGGEGLVADRALRFWVVIAGIVLLVRMLILPLVMLPAIHSIKLMSIQEDQIMELLL